MSVASLSVNLKANTASFTTEMDKARSAARQAMSETRKEIQESNHSLGLFGETFGVTVPKHIRTFVSQLPGVSKAMSAAFDGLAILVLMKVIMEAVEKVKQLHEAFNAAAEAPKKIAEGFEKLNVSTEANNHQLELSIIHTENAIAKLEHKPRNLLAEALAEAAVAADKLSDHLLKDIAEAKTLLEQQNIGRTMQMLTNSSGTQQAQDITAFVADSLAKIPHDASFAKNAETVYREAWNRAQYEINRNNEASAAYRKFSGASSDNKYANANTALYGLQSKLSTGYRGMDLTAELGNVTSEEKKVQDRQRSSRDAAEARRKALEAARKAEEEALKAEEDEVKLRQSIHGMSLQEEVSYWTHLAKSSKEGSQRWITEVNNAHTAQEKLDTKANAARVKAMSEDEHGTEEITRSMTELFAKQGEAQEKSISAQIVNAAKATSAQSDLDTRYKLATGQISAQAAMHEEASNKLRLYNVELTQLLTNLANLKAQGADPAKIEAAQTAVADKQGQIATTKAGVADADKTATAMGSARTGVNLFWQEMANQSQNTALKIRDTMGHGMSDLNNDIIGMINGQKVSWAGLFKSIGDGLIQLSLKTMEGGLFKSLGGALHIPGFASGGDPDPYGVSIVGENGPELFAPRGVSGTVTNNRDLRNMLGSGEQPTIHIGSIDARDTNAAEVDRRVRQGSLAAYQQAMQDSHTQRMEHNARVPSHARY